MCACVRIPAGEACSVRPVEGELLPHPTAVQATRTKLESVYGSKPVAHKRVLIYTTKITQGSIIN